MYHKHSPPAHRPGCLSEWNTKKDFAEKDFSPRQQTNYQLPRTTLYILQLRTPTYNTLHTLKRSAPLPQLCFDASHHITNKAEPPLSSSAALYETNNYFGLTTGEKEKAIVHLLVGYKSLTHSISLCLCLERLKTIIFNDLSSSTTRQEKNKPKRQEREGGTIERDRYRYIPTPDQFHNNHNSWKGEGGAGLF